MIKKVLKKETKAQIFWYNKLNMKNIISKNMIEYKEKKFYPFNVSRKI